MKKFIIVNLENLFVTVAAVLTITILGLPIYLAVTTNCYFLLMYIFYIPLMITLNEAGD